MARDAGPQAPAGAPRPAGTGRRRPRDGATITTPRYRFRYDGRWLMTAIQIKRDRGTRYGPDLVDRWKARAFAQDPGSQTPCCGYEEEHTNWGGSSTLLGERVGPVRAIRETWGADSGTNVIRRETFYRDEMVQKTWLRVHVIPPLDGIYAQWDFNAGRSTRFCNSRRPGRACRSTAATTRRSATSTTRATRSTTPTTRARARPDLPLAVRALGACELPLPPESVDLPDLTFSEANASLGWTRDRAGRTARSSTASRRATDPDARRRGAVAARGPLLPRRRLLRRRHRQRPGPRSCFPRRAGAEARSRARRHRRAAAGAASRRRPGGDDHFWQGSIGTHGLHLLFVADSDNARQTVPLDEIVSDWRMVMLPGDAGDAGERYGREFEQPIVPVVSPAA